MTKRLFQKEKYYLLKFLFDGFLLAAAFFSVYYLKRGTFYHQKFLNLEPRFRTFFLVLMVIWMFVTLLSKKFTQIDKTDYFSLLKPYTFSALMMTGAISIVLFTYAWFDLSRVIVFGTIGLFYVLEMVVFSIRFFLKPPPGESESTARFPAIFFLAEFSILTLSFSAIFYFKRKELIFPDPYLLFLMGVILLWFIISLIFHKFDIKRKRSYLKTLTPFLQSQGIIIGSISIFIYLTNLMFFSRTIILGTLIVFAFFENLAVTLFYLRSQGPITDESDLSLFKVNLQENEQLELEDLYKKAPPEKYAYPQWDMQTTLFKRKLQEVYLKKFQGVYDFVHQRVDLENLDILHSVVIYSRNPYNVEIMEDDSLQFFVNLRQINDFRKVNEFFKLINNKLTSGGVYVGKFESLTQRRNRFFTGMPYAIATILYPFSFLLRRVIPKLSIFKPFYYGVTRGNNRALSMAESLGRLYYCGFEVLELKEIEGFTWFVAKKVKEPPKGLSPEYGLVFKQKRVGRAGKFIHMYKMRTMHPYSEYIHEFVLSHLDLDEKGKIKNDFRITRWGKVFRALWIDELPMIYNLIKGDIKIVGVRPLSKSFFDTYPEELKLMRIKYKPGLVPPYYADMPNGMEEVFESERRYLERLGKKPIRTDIAYFFKAFKNILFHHAKSG